MASSCHLNWTELYKNAKLLLQREHWFCMNFQEMHMIGLSIWSLITHIIWPDHNISPDFPEGDFPSLACFAYLLSFINDQVFRQDSSSVSASHRSCVFSKDCEKHTKRAKDTFNCFSKCHSMNLQDLQVHMSCKWLQNFKFSRFLRFLIEKEWF